MVRMKEKEVRFLAIIITALLVIAFPARLLRMPAPVISRIPASDIYLQGVQLNQYVNTFLPILIVLAILFIAGLSTFGLYHGVTREKLGRRLLISRPLVYIKAVRKEK